MHRQQGHHSRIAQQRHVECAFQSLHAEQVRIVLEMYEMPANKVLEDEKQVSLLRACQGQLIGFAQGGNVYLWGPR